MKLCPACYGYGQYPSFIFHGGNGIPDEPCYEPCETCEMFGHVFENNDERHMFLLLTTEEEREGWQPKLK